MNTIVQRKDILLRNTLKGNALFSLFSGVAAIAGASPLADFLGLEEPLALAVLGALLTGHAAILWWGATQAAIPRWLARYAIEGDVGWIIATLIVLIADPWGFSNEGKWLLAGIADIVAVFAILQYIGLRLLKHA
jgi:hypothetical protein